ncbi:hypothetical protein RFI_23699, partial [Reticulomyxa filosa]
MMNEGSDLFFELEQENQNPNIKSNANYNRNALYAGADEKSMESELVLKRLSILSLENNSEEDNDNNNNNVSANGSDDVNMNMNMNMNMNKNMDVDMDMDIDMEMKNKKRKEEEEEEEDILKTWQSNADKANILALTAPRNMTTLRHACTCRVQSGLHSRPSNKLCLHCARKTQRQIATTAGRNDRIRDHRDHREIHHRKAATATNIFLLNKNSTKDKAGLFDFHPN